MRSKVSLNVLTAILKYSAICTSIFLTGWGVNSAITAARQTIVMDTRLAVEVTIKPMQDSIALITQQLKDINVQFEFAKSRDTLIYNSFNRYRQANAKSDKEVINYLREIQCNIPIFMRAQEQIVDPQKKNLRLTQLN